MSENKLTNYFSATPSNSSKRRKSYSSPSSQEYSAEMGSEKVGDLTQAQLMAGLSALLDDKLVNLATKADLQGVVDKVDRLAEENRLLKEEVSQLKAQEKLVASKLVDLEGRARRNNLIFKGLTWKGMNPDYREIVRRFCTEVLGSSDRIWINRAHPLGKDRKTLIAHIPDDGDVEYIMRNASRLKGTNYIVHRDFPQEIRTKRARLAAVRKEVDQVAGNVRMPLIYDHLIVRGVRFTWEDGKLVAGREDGGVKLGEMFKRDFTAALNRIATQTTAQRDHSPQRTPTPTPASGQSSPLPQTFAEAVTGTGTKN